VKIIPKEIDFRKRNLVFVDIETTGLEVERHEIIEIGAIVVSGKNLKALSEYCKKIIPEHIETADKEALRLNGYSEEKWKDAILLKDALIKLNRLAKNGMFTGWNITFDWTFLEKAFTRFKIKPLFDYHLIDAMSIAYAKLYDKKLLKRLGLRHVVKFYKMKGIRHRAMEDSQATYQIFKRLMLKNE